MAGRDAALPALPPFGKKDLTLSLLATFIYTATWELQASSPLPCEKGIAALASVLSWA